MIKLTSVSLIEINEINRQNEEKIQCFLKKYTKIDTGNNYDLFCYIYNLVAEW